MGFKWTYPQQIVISNRVSVEMAITATLSIDELHFDFVWELSSVEKKWT